MVQLVAASWLLSSQDRTKASRPAGPAEVESAQRHCDARRRPSLARRCTNPGGGIGSTVGGEDTKVADGIADRPDQNADRPATGVRARQTRRPAAMVHRTHPDPPHSLTAVIRLLRGDNIYELIP